ncbi:MAG: helix-turn-helix transcriptional regulator [Saprospiraceae bacterium]|nr:helix-turn-helix transcriptional regulator [Saprospiraceae bacterium]
MIVSLPARTSYSPEKITMNKQQQIFQLRTRKLGLLIFDARSVKHKTLEETAQAVGIPSDELQKFEKAEAAPSLPTLEALAYYLDVPIDQFWSSSSLSEKVEEETIQHKDRLRQLRNRIIGASLKMGRTKLNFSLHEVSAVTTIPEDTLNRYEMGEISVPLPELEALAKTYDIRIEQFFDQKGPIGKRRAQQIAIRQFLELTPEYQEFVCQTVNRPYLNLAIRLSDLSVEKLRGIAEGLLEITF